jgi:hypothetical protein
MAYQAAPEPTGNVGAFREFQLTHSRELMPERHAGLNRDFPVSNPPHDFATSALA